MIPVPTITALSTSQYFFQYKLCISPILHLDRNISKTLYPTVGEPSGTLCLIRNQRTLLTRHQKKKQDQWGWWSDSLLILVVWLK